VYYRLVRLGGSLLLAFLGLALGPASSSAAALPVTAAVGRTLVGNAGGGIDTYAFSIPQPTGQTQIWALFSPPDIADGSRGGFNVILNGTQIGSAAKVGGSQGLMQYTLPHAPSGTVVIQVFLYGVSAPANYSISTSGSPGATPGGPAALNGTAAAPTSLVGEKDGTLQASPTGSFGYFTFPYAGSSPPTTLSLTYSPADSTVNQAVGFTVFDAYGNNIGSVTQPANQNFSADTLTVDLGRNPGEPLSVQVFNYAQGVTVSYSLYVSGIAPAPVAPSTPGAAGVPPNSSFQQFWIENFIPTDLWSGPGGGAASFGAQPQFSAFLVVQPQTGSRLYVYNPRTQNYAFIDANAVGPSGPPS